MSESKEIALVLTGTLPEIAGNFDECKSFYTSELEKYKAVVTQETLPTAKADLTKLRAEVKRLDRIRIDEETRLKAPITAMAAKVKEITGMVAATITQIETQVKVFEDETRNSCKMLMQSYLVERYESLAVRKEYQTGDVSPLVGISKLTSKGALTKEARENIEGLAMQGRIAQDRVDGRIAAIGAGCLAAGLTKALPVEYFEKYLNEPDPIWHQNSARIIKIAVDEKAREAVEQEAREKKKIADALAAQQVEADRLAKVKADAEQAEKNRLEKEAKDKADAEAKAAREAQEKIDAEKMIGKKPEVVEPPPAKPEPKPVVTVPATTTNGRIIHAVTVHLEILGKPESAKAICSWIEKRLLGEAKAVNPAELKGVTCLPKN